MRGPLAITVAVVLAVAGVFAQQARKEVVLHTLSAYDTLYVLSGGGENAVALMRDDGVVLIDPLPFGWGKASMEAIEAVCDQPVRTIINVRASEDHLKANTEYPMATKIIAHQSLAARARQMPAFAGANARFLPNTVVADRLTLLDGPDEINLYAHGPAITDGDLVVLFRAKSTAYLGALYPSKSVPSIDAARGGSPHGFVQALAKIRVELKDTRNVIAGNEPPRNVELGKPGAAMPISATPSWKEFEEYAERAAAAYAAADEIVLFNGKDFAGWTFYLEEKDYNVGGKGKISDFATVTPDGVIEIHPKLHGALMTEKDYRNYKLHAEWRWVDPTYARNNSGLFLRITPPFNWSGGVHQYMVQIQPPNSGDLWVLGYDESQLTTDRARSFKPFGDLEVGGKVPAFSTKRHLITKDAEKPAGEWNAADVTINGTKVTVYINGELVNEGTNLVDVPGRIGLESEFGPIQFRNIRLTPIDK
jgi:hypothetical protein